VQKTRKFLLKQALKEATSKSSKKPQTHKKISPNSWENRMLLENTGVQTISSQAILRMRDS